MIRLTRDVVNQHGDKIGLVEIVYDHGVIITAEGPNGTEEMTISHEMELALFELMTLVRPILKPKNQPTS